MAFVQINPPYQGMLARTGLVEAEPFLALSGVIVCGHPDRHVAQVTLGRGPEAVRAYLKREHRVPWRDRLANFCAGFGPVSKSYREAQTLQALRGAGVGCPDWIAVGEDDAGRAFLLTRELTGATELRAFLRQCVGGRPLERRRFAVHLGEELAHLHEVGFDYPDLHSKHVFVDAGQESIYLLDGQRTVRRPRLGWPRRWHNLAALEATLADSLASPRDRLAFLHAYLRASLPVRPPRAFVAEAVRCIRARSRRLLGHRYIREVRQPPLALGSQNLLWLDGEALCVTREFRDSWKGAMPAWLRPGERPANAVPALVEQRVDLPDASEATLVRRRRPEPLRWFWTWLSRRPRTSPELQQAGTLFRLQRYGVGTPRLLAVGQRPARPWHMDSFLLTAVPRGANNLADWLAERFRDERWTVERKQRWRAIRDAANLLRGMHEAHCHLRRSITVCPLLVQIGSDAIPRVSLAAADQVFTVRRPRARWAQRDLALARRWLGAGGTRTDQLRFLLRYLGLSHLTPAAKCLARRIRAADQPLAV